MTAADHELLETVFTRSLDVLAAADPEVLRDVYVVSIYVEDEHEFSPELRLGWNTNARWKACSPKPGQKPKSPTASSAGEAKWNYAFWLQGESHILGGRDEGADRELKDKWMQANDFYFTPQQYDEDYDEYVRLTGLCSSALWRIGTELAKRLRSHETFRSIFGPSIPIIVHELHMDGREEEYVREANPDGQADDYFDCTAVDPHTGALTKG